MESKLDHDLDSEFENDMDQVTTPNNVDSSSEYSNLQEENVAQILDDMSHDKLHQEIKGGHDKDPTQFDYSMKPLHANGRRLLHMPHFETHHSHTNSDKFDHHHLQFMHFLSVMCVFSMIFVMLVIAAYCFRLKNKVVKKHI